MYPELIHTLRSEILATLVTSHWPTQSQIDRLNAATIGCSHMVRCFLNLNDLGEPARPATRDKATLAQFWQNCEGTRDTCRLNLARGIALIDKEK
jgi:hypothetical protein